MSHEWKARLECAVLIARAAGAVAFAVILLTGCDAWVGPDTRVERAQAHLAKGQVRPAMTELKTALQQHPDHVQARVALAELALWLGDLEGATKEIERARAAGAPAAQVRPVQYELFLAKAQVNDLLASLSQDDALPPVRRLVLEARAAGIQGEPAQAQAKLKLALEAAPDDPEALLESARLAAAQGDMDAALQLPTRLSGAEDELRARALFLRGAALVTRGEYDQARVALTEALLIGKRMRAPEQFAAAAALTEVDLALGDIQAAEKSIAGLMRWGPESLLAYYFKARIAMLKSDFSVAVAECQRALRIQPSHPQSQLLLAAAHISQGSVEQAEDVLKRLLASNPDNVAARKLLAQVYLGRDQPDQAHRLLGSAAGADSDPELDWLRGAALLRTGSTATGLEHLERSVAAVPGDTGRRIDLAGAYIAAQMPDKALEVLASVPADSPAASRAKVVQVMAVAAGKPRAEARRDIENLLEQHPKDSALAIVAGAYLAEVGEPVIGRKLLEDALELDPRSVSARLALARLEGAQRDLAQAERRFNEVVQLDPSNQIARIGLAELAWAAGDRDRSRKQLEEAVSANPAAIEPRLRLAQIAFLQGDPNRARGLLDQALSVATDRKAVLASTGRVLANAGLSDEALARFREASAAGDVSAVLHMAQLHFELGQLREARGVLQSALKSRPDWREAEQILVMIDAREGNVDLALERALKLAGKVAPAAARVIEGDLYSLAGRNDAALAAYVAAQREEPSSTLAVKIFNLRKASGVGDAELSLQQWLARAPEDADVRRVLAAHYESSHQIERAVAEYERLAAGEQVDPTVLNNLAWMLHQKGDPRALDLARRAYAAAPHFAEISDTYGWILVQMDKVADGLPVLEKALAKAPANPEIQYHAAFAYAKSGQTARATDLLQKSLQTSDAFPSRAAAEQLLQAMAAQKT